MIRRKKNIQRAFDFKVKVIEGVVKDGLGCKSGGFYTHWSWHEKDLKLLPLEAELLS